MGLADIVKMQADVTAPRILLHGIQGVGKSTFAAGAPSPIFLPTEDGLTTINVAQFPLSTNVEEVFGYIEMLWTEEHQYKTFVLDTVDWLEKLIWDQVRDDLGVKAFGDIDYGKGYVLALDYWDKLIRGLNKLREQCGMAIILLAHNEIKTYRPPDVEPYDRYQIKLHKSAAAKLEEWADAVLFANFKVLVDKKTKKATGMRGDQARIIHTADNPAWRAKTRYKIPDELPLDIAVLMDAIAKSK